MKERCTPSPADDLFEDVSGLQGNALIVFLHAPRMHLVSGWQIGGTSHLISMRHSTHTEDSALPVSRISLAIPQHHQPKGPNHFIHSAHARFDRGAHQGAILKGHAAEVRRRQHFQRAHVCSRCRLAGRHPDAAQVRPHLVLIQYCRPWLRCPAAETCCEPCARSGRAPAMADARLTPRPRYCWSRKDSPSKSVVD